MAAPENTSSLEQLIAALKREAGSGDKGLPPVDKWNPANCGEIGMESRLSMVPRSTSRVTESAVNISIVMVRMVPVRPGTILSALTAAGL